MKVKLEVGNVKVSRFHNDLKYNIFHVYSFYEKWLKIWLIKLDQNIIEAKVMFIYIWMDQVLFLYLMCQCTSLQAWLLCLRWLFDKLGCCLPGKLVCCLPFWLTTNLTRWHLPLVIKNGHLYRHYMWVVTKVTVPL